MTEVTYPMQIARGNLRRVKLGELPDNSKLFDKIHETDCAVRYVLSPPLADGVVGIRYMDLLIWMKPDVAFDTNQIIDMGQHWAQQIQKEAILEGWEDISTPLSISEYQDSMNKSLPASESKMRELDNLLNLSEVLAGDSDPFQVDATRLWIPDGRGLKGAILVEVNKARSHMRPVGSTRWLTTENGRMAPLPRPATPQGTLTVAKVREPKAKVGPDGWKLIVSGSLAGCSAILILSDVFDWCDKILFETIYRQLNYKWSDIYERVAMDSDEFEKLVQHTGFKLKRPFYQVTRDRLQVLMRNAECIEYVDWKYPPIKFTPSYHRDTTDENYPKMKLSDLTQDQRSELELNLVNYLPTVDWPNEGESTMIPAPFGDVELSWDEWTSILNGYDSN